MRGEVLVPSHCLKPGVYRGLRGMGLSRWIVLRVMWHGATLEVVEGEAP